MLKPRLQSYKFPPPSEIERFTFKTTNKREKKVIIVWFSPEIEKFTFKTTNEPHTHTKKKKVLIPWHWYNIYYKWCIIKKYTESFKYFAPNQNCLRSRKFNGSNPAHPFPLSIVFRIESHRSISTESVFGYYIIRYAGYFPIYEYTIMYMHLKTLIYIIISAKSWKNKQIKL